jgi:peroxiredoxin Q/BCP
MSLQVGDPAPDFSLPNQNGDIVRLPDLQGQWVVLYFYPKDDTPGCTKEACGFRDHYGAIAAKNAVILGVSLNDAKSHHKFISKYNLPFQLLVDSNAEVATAYGCYGLKKFMGKEYMGISRTTYLIDPDGKIAKLYTKVKPEHHAAEILQDLG